MYPGKPMPRVNKRLNKHATTIMFGGIFLFFSGLLYLALCSVPCEQRIPPDMLERHVDGGKIIGDILRQPFHTNGQNTNKDKAFLVILIITSPKNGERRDIIRQTWLSNLPKDAIPFFVIGTANLAAEEDGALQYENSIHRDLLLLPDLNESYRELTTKVLKSFMWVDQKVDCKYIFKADDDTYVRIDKITEELHQMHAADPTALYWGFFDGRGNVKRQGKWAEKEWMLCDTYITHALGGGYILSSDLVSFISQNNKFLKKYKSEDVSVGTWLAALDIRRKHDPRFDTEFRSRGCHNDYLVTHKQTVAMMKVKHETLKETGKLCKKEIKFRNSYIYNWNVPPSQCCIRNDSSVP